MRKILFVGMFCLVSSVNYAQVGVGTESPRGALEVSGSVIATDFVFPENLPAVTENIRKDYNLIVQNLETNNLEILDVRNSDNIGIAALMTFRLKNPQGDWIESFNTKINADNYALVVLNGYFTDNLTGGSNSLPGVGAYINANNEWVINADYPSINSTDTFPRAWIVRCSIFPKNFVKIFPQQNIDMNNSSVNTNTGGTPILN